MDMSAFQNSTAPFEDYPEAAHKRLEDIENIRLSVLDFKVFENDKGPGVFVLLGDDNGLKYICTHSSAVVKAFDNEDLRNALATEQVFATFTRKVGKTGRYYWVVS